MKKLVFENENAVHEINTYIASGKPIANDLAAEFNKLPLKKISTPDHVVKMLQDLPGFIETMLPDGEPVKIMGVTLKPARIIELMDLDLQPLKSKIAATKKGIDQRYINFFLELAKYTKGKGFEVDPEKLAERLETFRYYAETPKQLEVAKLFEQLTQAAQKMFELGISEHQLNGKPLGHWIEYRNGKFLPNMNRLTELAN
jgi:hypothetical protein